MNLTEKIEFERGVRVFSTASLTCWEQCIPTNFHSGRYRSMLGFDQSESLRKLSEDEKDCLERCVEKFVDTRNHVQRIAAQQMQEIARKRAQEERQKKLAEAAEKKATKAVK
eukprot:TRINITY_DN10341_c0_g1_i1.p1 TRINITY_DN10341_c0_g1~~TRINITY_DN10341_c0_g1_i1.p1  ORF type:complete len:112 (+),score=36.48 TRINITY_DN10341_c0_g1_i1:126-461(+)